MTASTLYHNREFNKLQEHLNNLLVKRANMDKDFSKFLDKYDSKMNENPFHPAWDLYRESTTKYNKLEYEIKSCNYYLNKSR
jgi:hypothetical protein